jgi:hypothetical protein
MTEGWGCVFAIYAMIAAAVLVPAAIITVLVVWLVRRAK